MKSVRSLLFFFLASATLLGVSACLSESGNGDDLNPQPLPPATNQPPEDGQRGGSGGAFGGDNTGSPPPAPNDPVPGAGDAGAPDAAHNHPPRTTMPRRND